MQFNVIFQVKRYCNIKSDLKEIQLGTKQFHFYSRNLSKKILPAHLDSYKGRLRHQKIDFSRHIEKYKCNSKKSNLQH